MNQEASVKSGKKFAALNFEEVERISMEEQSKYERNPAEERVRGHYFSPGDLKFPQRVRFIFVYKV